MDHLAQIDTGGKRQHKRLIAHPTRGPLVQQLFSRVAAGEETHLVLRWLAIASGEPVWTHQAFYSRIRNPIYYGLIEYGLTAMPAGRPRKTLDREQITTGRWEGIVSEEIWNKAGETIAARNRGKRNQGAKAMVPYLLTGLIRCSDCGGTIIGGRSGQERRYRCSNRQCGSSTVKADRL